MKLKEVAQTPARELVNRAPHNEGSSLELYVHGPNTVELMTVQATEGKGGQGFSTKALRDLVQIADELGVKLELNVHWLAPEGEEPNMRNDKLESWYRKFGFTRTEKTKDLDIHSGEVYMERDPK